MLSFKKFLIEAPSWEDHLRQIGHVVRNPDLFGVEFVDTDYLEPETKTTGSFYPNTFKIKIATRGDEKTSPLFKDSTFLNSGVFRGEVYPSVDDNLAHEGAHLIQKVRQNQKHGPFLGLKGRAGPYERRQAEIDARSAARGSRIVSTYNQRFADIMDRFPVMGKTPESIDIIKNQLRGFNFREARDAERINAAENRLGKVPYRRAKQTDKQTMAAIYAAEKGLPQNITDPEVMKAFIERHKVKTPEATTPTRQATPSPEATTSTRQATPSGARRAMSTRSAVGAMAAASGVGAMGTAFNQATDVSGILTPPPPRERMQGEKSWGTDTGLAFDYIDGELVASPEGFKAVRQREKEGRSFPGPYAR